MKKKVSEQLAEDHKKNEKKIRKDSKRQLRKNKKKVLAN